MDHDAHNYTRRLEGQIRRIEKDPAISEANKSLIYRFKDGCFSDGLSKGRVVRYLFDLRTIAQLMNKDFGDVNKDDIRDLIFKLGETGRFSKTTIRDFKVTLKKFFRWLRKSDDFPEEVKWLKTNLKRESIKTPEDMLTEEEIQRMISVSKDIRDRAFVSTLYESGCRIGELLLLKLNQVKFDEYGAQLLVNGKTGFRRIRVVASVPYLKEWINKQTPFTE